MCTTMPDDFNVPKHAVRLTVYSGEYIKESGREL